MKFLLFIALFLSLSLGQQPDTYDPEFSMSMVYYAKAAVCSKSTIENWDGGAMTRHPDMTDIHVVTNEVHDSQMYLGYDPATEFIVMSFRGSVNTENWITDFDFFLTDYPACEGCQIHEGFYKAWLSIQDEVLDTYHQIYAKHPGAKLVLTGHSLGAAEATVAALACIDNNIPVYQVYVYGCPRVGNPALSVYGSQVLPQYIEVVHYKDPVPHLPLQSMGFKRIPTEVFYYSKKDSSLWEWCPSAGGEENPDCSDKYKYPLNFSDHDVYLGIHMGCGANATFEEKIRSQMISEKLKPILQEMFEMEEQLEIEFQE